MTGKRILSVFLMVCLILIRFGKISSASSIVHHQIDLSIDLSLKKIVGSDTLILEVTDAEIPIRLAEGLAIEKIKSGSDSLPYTKIENKNIQDGPEEGVPWTSYIIKIPDRSVGKMISILLEYEGTYSGIDFDKEKRHFGLEVGGYLNSRSGLLLEDAHWYPEIEGQNKLFTYQLAVQMEKGIAVVSSGIRTVKGEVIEFKMEHPTDEINLVFGPYYITQDHYHEIEISTYFSRDNPEMAEAYLRKMKEYLKQDECELGNYPYKTLAVVDSPILVGLGFPGFTLIGDKLLSIPDIINTSLRHEILHNWYGSGIYVSPGSGNWTEGLVTYLADHQFNLKQNGGPESRLGLLKQYAVATRGKPEKSLNQIGDGDAPEDRAVAYSKSAMIFSMLANRIGKNHFYKGLKVLTLKKMYQSASWDDFRKAFESESGQNLEPFFEQWIYKAGAPQVTIKQLDVRPHTLLTPFSVTFTLHTEPFYQLDLPVEVQTQAGTERKTVSINKSDQKVLMLLSAPAKEIRVDPNYRVMRRLNDNELPANMSIVLRSNQDLAVLYSKSLTLEAKKRYEHFLQMLKLKSYEIQDLSRTRAPVLIFGPPDSGQKIGNWEPSGVPWHWEKESLEVKGERIQSGNDSGIISWYGPAGYAEPLVWIVGYSDDGLKSLAQRLGYYISWSYLFLRDGKSVVRGEWENPSETLGIPVFN
ncbi:MAG: M1 family metallopeptidase [Nitrospiria bacterium]